MFVQIFKFAKAKGATAMGKVRQIELFSEKGIYYLSCSAASTSVNMTDLINDFGKCHHLSAIVGSGGERGF
jgi:hypothetical protein